MKLRFVEREIFVPTAYGSSENISQIKKVKILQYFDDELVTWVDVPLEEENI